MGAFQLADFAQRCGVDRNLLEREAARLAKLAMEHAPEQALAGDYIDDGERAFAGRLRDFVMGQATRLTKLASEAAKKSPSFCDAWCLPSAQNRIIEEMHPQALFLPQQLPHRRSQIDAALSRVPVARRYEFFQEQSVRAQAHGLQAEGDLEAYCGTAAEFGPRFDDEEAVKAAFVGLKGGKAFHEVLATVSNADWQRMRELR